MSKVKIFSDGAAKGNPDGPGGYGIIIQYLDDEDKIEKVEEFAGGYPMTTNNRMELMGVIVALEQLKSPSTVTIVTDSQYVINAFNEKWIIKWESNGWLTSSNKPVKNLDLWKQLLNLKKPHDVKFEWVRGHFGHKENERCDYLASMSAEGYKFKKNEKGILEIDTTKEESKDEEDKTDSSQKEET